MEFKTCSQGIVHQRTLLSSATTSNLSSRIALDAFSSQLQSRSVVAILADFVGAAKRPLLVLDSSAALRQRGRVPAAIAAALSLQPLSTNISFLLKEPQDASTMNWDAMDEVLASSDELLVYGLTWMLWLAWGAASFPSSIGQTLRTRRIDFVHSGGWKKLEQFKVDHERFNTALLEKSGPGSKVVDYYGLVEQVGVVYPLCEYGFRHVPVWAEVLVRDTYSMDVLESGPGQLHLLNVLAYGAPYHSVLTEDMGALVTGVCPCGREGKRFELLGRLPKAEARGCANV
jgi:hypothetical protein